MPSQAALLVIDLQIGVVAGCVDAAAVLSRTATHDRVAMSADH